MNNNQRKLKQLEQKAQRTVEVLLVTIAGTLVGVFFWRPLALSGAGLTLIFFARLFYLASQAGKLMRYDR